MFHLDFDAKVTFVIKTFVAIYTAKSITVLHKNTLHKKEEQDAIYERQTGFKHILPRPFTPMSHHRSKPSLSL